MPLCGSELGDTDSVRLSQALASGISVTARKNGRAVASDNGPSTD